VQAVKRVRSRSVLGTLKTAGSRRTLAAPAPVVEALRDHRIRQLEERLAVGAAWLDHGLVFTNTLGGLVDATKFNRAFSATTKRAGLGHWHPHELRHSFVSLASFAGVREEDVADVVGHVTTRMTHRVYRHQVTPTLTAGKAAMERLFGGQVGGQPPNEGSRDVSHDTLQPADQPPSGWAWRDLNPRPPARHAGALPPELHAREATT
jgi:integrase